MEGAAALLVVEEMITFFGKTGLTGYSGTKFSIVLVPLFGNRAVALRHKETSTILHNSTNSTSPHH